MAPVAQFELPLIGLLNDLILPGETRTFVSPTVDRSTLEALSTAAPERLAGLCITNVVELPSLITARWATVCRVGEASCQSLTLCGEQRARVQAVRGAASPYTAVLDAEGDQPADLSSLVTEAHRLLAALDVGGRPENPGWNERLRSALGELLRALANPEQLRQALRLPLPEALREISQTLAVQASGHEAECTLEKALRELANRPELPTAMRHRLWSQVVALEKRLDVYDPLQEKSEDDELGGLQRRLQQAGLPPVARATAKRELRLLRQMSSSNHDYATYLGHLQFMARLPWHPDEVGAFDLQALQQALDAEHFGLEKPKQRILEYFAVRQLGGTATGTVLCMAGPPGVGKTSLGRVIAQALQRPFIRVPLGGVHDECEIRGHRLSFVAAAPGRILKGVADAGSQSAVMLLDELDKISVTRDRSPAAALLEVLDPEQNSAFRDHYLSVPYDLSNVLFLCTANDLEAIPHTLRDRLELIELEGYSSQEKREIARRHLIGRVTRDCGLAKPPELPDEVLDNVIEGHTREAGVRQLTRCLGSLFRARALAMVRARSNPDDPKPLAGEDLPVDKDELQRVLGAAPYLLHCQPKQLPVGVATGLTFSTHGGATLFIEVGRMPGNGDLRLTGRLGSVMRESARAALARLRMDPQRYGVDPAQLVADFHVHVPEAAIAKEGPSAGIALFVAFVSACCGRPVLADVALTGELTLSGTVLPIGGVRTKLLAAERAGLRAVILPAANLSDVPDGLRLQTVLVQNLDEVVAAAFDAAPLDDRSARGAPDVSKELPTMTLALRRANVR